MILIRCKALAWPTNLVWAKCWHSNRDVHGSWSTFKVGQLIGRQWIERGMGCVHPLGVRYVHCKTRFFLEAKRRWEKKIFLQKNNLFFFQRQQPNVLISSERGTRMAQQGGCLWTCRASAIPGTVRGFVWLGYEFPFYRTPGRESGVALAKFRIERLFAGL